MVRFLLFTAFMLLLTSCGQGEDSAQFAWPRFDNEPGIAFQNVAQQTDYVGDAACAACHEDVYSSYQSHGMANSYYALTPQNRIEPLSAPVKHESTGFFYEVKEDEQGLYQEEYMLSDGGEKIHSLKRYMEFVMGSGSAARTYITEHEDRLYQLPLTWYAQEEKWDFSPGYKEKNGRFDRLIPDRCMACHNGHSESIPFEEGKYASVPEGIGCERCHGPGALHVEERYALPEPSDSIDITIVNPAHLPFKQRLDVCQQCHFSAPAMVLREGRQAFDFKPSESLDEHLAVFIDPRDDEDAAIDVVSHADRMRMSACYLETLDQVQPLECTTCHNPHEGFRDQGPAYFNSTCQSCHSIEALSNAPEVHTADANCSGCHMPKVRANDAPHSSFTDHYIQINGRTPPESTTPESSDPLVPYFAKDVRNRTGQGYLGMALVIQGSRANNLYQVAQGASTLDVALQSDSTLGNGYFLLGVAHQTLGDVEKAVPALEKAVRLNPENPERVLALALAYEQMNKPVSVIEQLYTLALNRYPYLSEVRLRYGQFLLSQGSIEEAGSAFEETTREHPWLAEASLYKGLVYLDQDQALEAEQAWQAALNLEPAYASLLNQVYEIDQAGALGQKPAIANPLIENDLYRTDIEMRVENENLVISLPVENAEVSIYAQNGKRLQSIKAAAGSKELSWDLKSSGIPTGIYLLQVHGDGTPLVTRFAVVNRSLAE